MFTIADIREIAVQIEKNGEAAYRKAGDAAADPALGEIFHWMADEEKRHGEWFAAIESDQPLTEEQVELERMGRQLLQDMVADQTFSLEQEQLGQVEGFTEMLSQSQSFEEDTILFYEFLQTMIGDPQARQQLEEIIAEERRHFEQLKEMESAGDGPCRNLALV
jgi:rubrerythrin